jgi:hypothetical protein
MPHARTIDMYVVSLLENTDFLKYVLDSDATQQCYWQRFEQERPQWHTAIEKATYILQHLDEMQNVLSEEELEALKRRISSALSVV